MAWQEIISQKNFSFERISSLIILLVTALTGMILIVCPFIDKFSNDKWDDIVSLIAIIFVDGSITLYWYYYRTRLPKGKKDKQNIVIAITTENNQQKTRISNDFTENLKLRLREYDLISSYDVIVVHSHLSKDIRKTIENVFYRKHDSLEGVEEKKKFNNMLRRLNAKFIVYGDLISRNSPNDKYCLIMEALICHNETDSNTGDELKKEFLGVWKKEIEFLETEELTGFKSTSNQVFFASSYMIGLATFVENRFDIGCQVYEKLMLYIQKNPDYVQYKGKIESLLSTSYYLESQKLYFLGDIDGSIEYRRKFHNLVPNEYGKCLIEAIHQVSKKNNPELALEFIERAEKLAKKSGVWKYNKFYLFIKLNRHLDALKILDNILDSSYKDEQNSVLQVISYNDTCLKKDQNHIQTYFIHGVFIYKKFDKPLLAYESLEKFVELTNSDANWTLLNERAKTYLSEIDFIIKLKKD